VVKSRVRSKVGAEVKGEKEGAKVSFPDMLSKAYLLIDIGESKGSRSFLKTDGQYLKA
jgi:hypothetical protein